VGRRRQPDRWAKAYPTVVGVALAGKYLDQLPYRVWVLCGDSELAEGSIWEAMDKASYYQLSNLITIVDVNRLGQRGERKTDLGWKHRGLRAPVRGRSARTPWSSTDMTWRPSTPRCRPPNPMPPATDPPSSSPKPLRVRAFQRSKTAPTGTVSRCRQIWPSAPSQSWAVNVTWCCVAPPPRRRTLTQ